MKKTFTIKNYKGNIVESLKKFQEKYPEHTIIEATSVDDELKIMTEWGGRNQYNSRFGGAANFHPLKLLSKTPGCPEDWFVGPASGGNKMNIDHQRERDIIYPAKRLKPMSMVMWNPTLRKTVAWASYCYAIKNHDEEAIAKIEEVGLPLNLDLGIGFDHEDNWF